jgi:signal peptide peptidase SppA
MTTYPAIRRALAGRLWFMHEPKMTEMLSFLEIKLAGGSSVPEVIASIRATNAASAVRAQRTASGGGSIAVIPVYGMLMQRPIQDISGGSSGTSTNNLSAALRQAVADPNVRSIVLDIDSPGGDVAGIDELASEIFAARKQKKITAVSNCLCASAAYYLGSQASEVVVSPSSQTGSIGVYCMHEDDSQMLQAAGIKLELIKYGANKAEGNNLGPLTDSARAHMQDMVDIYGVQFEQAVARGRRITQRDVHNNFGQGRVFDAKTAVRIGMADRVGTLNDAISSAASSAGARQPSMLAMKHELRLAALGVQPERDRKAKLEQMRRQLDLAARG